MKLLNEPVRHSLTQSGVYCVSVLFILAYTYSFARQIVYKKKYLFYLGLGYLSYLQSKLKIGQWFFLCYISKAGIFLNVKCLIS